MPTFVINFGVCLLVTTASIWTWAICLRIGLRWFKVEGITTRQLWVATWLSILASIVVVIGKGFLEPSVTLKAALWREIGTVAASVGITTLVISRVFAIHFGRALGVFLPTLLANLASLAVMVFLVIPYCFEAFVSPTNAMAPSIRGMHFRGICPTCGEPCIGTSNVEQYRFTHQPEPMICRRFHVHPVETPPREVYPSDRFIVSKYVKPKRWDIIAFRYPEERSIKYLMRLVGLPGETIVIRNGQVFANDQLLTPPPHLSGIVYESESTSFHRGFSGTESLPAKLGSAECFVLGDFSQRSSDSRYWTAGVEGHPPYAVPEADILGVATQIYWPPSRWMNLP